MPAEAVHLSALADAMPAFDAEAARAIAAHPDAARLGAILVDLPYFERFSLELVRYLLGRPPRASRWGDRFHRDAPSQVGWALVREARRAHASSRGPLLALALGYVSHCAVDWTMHPMVNRLAHTRSLTSGATASAEHREVEKLQSVLFHEERFGVEFLGSTTLRRHIGVPVGRLLLDDALHEGVDRALVSTLGDAPSRAAWALWSRGYAHYVTVLGTPPAKLLVTSGARVRERGRVYDEPDLPTRHREAVACVERYVGAAFAAFEADTALAAYRERIPEGSIDEPPT